MRSRLALAVLVAASIVLSAAPLPGAETMWEMIVPTDLLPSETILPDPLPEPAPIAMEILAAEPAPALAPQISLGPRLPSFAPRARTGKALFDANLILMVGLNVADYISTRQALKYPGLTETNPLMKPFVKSPAAFAAVKLGTTALTYVSMKAIFKRNRTVAWVMTTATNALLSFVVANNFRMIQGARAAAR